MATYEEDHIFEGKTNAFVEWLLQRPSVSISPKIQITDLRDRNAGRGIVAIQDIHEDEELFSIGQSDVLSVENSELHALHPNILQHLDSWHSLVLVMIYEDGRGHDSKWRPYLKILPHQFDTLIYWSPSELAQLQGSAVLDKIGKEAAEQIFQNTLLPIVQEKASLFGEHGQKFCGPDAVTTLLDLAHRMATLIMAYGFDLENEPPSEEDEEEEEGGSSQSAYELHKGMIPLADMFNADGDLNNAHLIQNESSMTMIALKDIRKGQQIYNDFGQLPRSDLLRRYGYVTDRYKKWDVVEVDIGTVTEYACKHNALDDIQKEQRLQMAANWEVLQDGYDLNRPPEGKRFLFDEDLLLTITALLLDSDGYKQAIALEEPPEQPPSAMLITIGLVLQDIIDKRLSAYQTSAAEDAALLQDDTVQGRWRMAIQVRLGEKEILAMAAEEVERRNSKHTHKATGHEDTSQVKKRRL